MPSEPSRNSLPPQPLVSSDIDPVAALGTCPAPGRFPSGSRNSSAGTFYSPPLTGEAPEPIDISTSAQGHLFRQRLCVVAFWAGETIGALCIFALPFALLLFGEIVR